MLTSSVEYTSLCPPSHYSLAFEPYLYNQESFLRLKEYEVQTFYVVDHKNETINARIHFAVQSSPDGSLRAISLPQLPFGSLEYNVSMSLSQLTNFIAFVRERLAQQEITSLEIRDCIPAYRIDKAELLRQVLLDQGFVVKEEAINHHIPVDEQPLPTKMRADQRGKRKKSINAHFTSVHEPIEQLPELYSFIEMSYQTRHRTLSLSLLDLQRYVGEFPSQYQLFSVYHIQKRIAACIAVRVTKTFLYTFYYTARLEYGSYSPTVLLLDSIYQYCQSQKVKVLDLGTSLTKSVYTFKARMGGIASKKYNYQFL